MCVRAHILKEGITTVRGVVIVREWEGALLTHLPQHMQAQRVPYTL